jgi:hypothetical protein
VEQLSNALHAALLAVPPMDDGDEKAANKILQSVGLPNLPTANDAIGAVPAQQVQQGNIDLPQMSAMNNAAAADRGQQPDMQLSFSPTSIPFNASIADVGGQGEGAMSFSSWSQDYFDDSTTPDWLWAGLLAPEMEIPGDPTQLATSWNTTIAPNHDDSQQHDDADPDIVNQIAARFGSLQLAPDGKLRYFGTPANAHVLNSNRLWTPSTAQRTLKSDGARLLRSAELDLEVEKDFEEHLTKVFFSWHNSCHPVVDEAMYWSSKNQRGDTEESSGFASEVLTNAMYLTYAPSQIHILR